ncbi:MAG: glycoside hydrolase family 16 protein [Bacteroidales bacterium]
MKSLFYTLTLLMALCLCSSCENEEPAADTYFLAIDVAPGDATITVNGGTYTASTKYASGDEVAWVVSKDGYIEQSGTVVFASANVELTITLEEEPPSYQLIWSDEFDGTEIDTNSWGYDVGGTGWGNSELQYYTDRSENSRIEDGTLIIDVLKETYVNRSYTSARLVTKNKVFFTYGKVEARISIPSGQGTWSAFWMLPETGSWPAAGEIDIMEHVGSSPTMISHATHTKNKNGSYGNNWSSRAYIDDVEENYHTYTMEWIADEDDGDDCIIFYIDDEQTGKVYQTHGSTDDADWPFTDDFHIILNVAMGGSWGGTIDDTIFENPVQMKVDWVRVYQLQ